jgi:hypothetical protein
MQYPNLLLAIRESGLAQYSVAQGTGKPPQRNRPARRSEARRTEGAQSSSEGI